MREKSSVSHDPSEIFLICRFTAQETLAIISNVENSCCIIFLRHIFFTLFFDEYEQHLFEIEIVCKIINSRYCHFCSV